MLTSGHRATPALETDRFLRARVAQSSDRTPGGSAAGPPVRTQPIIVDVVVVVATVEVLITEELMWTILLIIDVYASG